MEWRKWVKPWPSHHLMLNIFQSYFKKAYVSTEIITRKHNQNWDMGKIMTYQSCALTLICRYNPHLSLVCIIAHLQKCVISRQDSSERFTKGKFSINKKKNLFHHQWKYWNIRKNTLTRLPLSSLYLLLKWDKYQKTCMISRQVWE